MQIANLPPSLEGMRIAHVSDLHIGTGPWKPIHAPEAAEVVRQEQPDVVVNTGDFLQGSPNLEKVDAIVSLFTASSAGNRRPAPHLAILGNHDYYAGDVMVGGLTMHLQHLDIQVLLNRAICVERDGAGVSFAGLTLAAPGFDRAVEDLAATSRPRIVLIHEPEVAERLPPGLADLVLAGHTHGGQITLPWLEPYIVRRFAKTKYVEGMYQVRGMPIYVNRGLGTTGLPIRFRARPEVAFITLVR